MENNISALAEQLVSGAATEDSVGIALRTIQISLSTKLIEQLDGMSKSVAKFNSLQEKLQNRLEQQVNELIDSDVLALSDCVDLYEKLEKARLNTAEFVRKTVQSPKSLFPEDVLSSDEAKVLALMKSFKSPEDKKNFLKALEKAALPPAEPADFDE